MSHTIESQASHVIEFFFCIQTKMIIGSRLHNRAKFPSRQFEALDSILTPIFFGKSSTRVLRDDLTTVLTDAECKKIKQAFNLWCLTLGNPEDPADYSVCCFNAARIAWELGPSITQYGTFELVDW